MPEATVPTPQEALRRVRALLEKGFTQHAFARGANGEQEPPCSDAATCWCLLGAHDRVMAETLGAHWEARDVGARLCADTIHAMHTAIKEATGTGCSLARFNDSHTQEEVVAMLRRAEELLNAATTQQSNKETDPCETSIK